MKNKISLNIAMPLSHVMRKACRPHSWFSAAEYAHRPRCVRERVSCDKAWDFPWCSSSLHSLAKREHEFGIHSPADWHVYNDGQSCLAPKSYKGFFASIHDVCRRREPVDQKHEEPERKFKEKNKTKKANRRRSGRRTKEEHDKTNNGDREA